MNTAHSGRPLTAFERAGVWFFKLFSSDVSSPSNMVRRATTRAAGFVAVVGCTDVVVSAIKGHSAGWMAYHLSGLVVIVATALALLGLSDDRLRTWALHKVGDDDRPPSAWRPMQSLARLLLIDAPPDDYVQRPVRRPWLSMLQLGVHIGSDELKQTRHALSKSLAVILLPVLLVVGYTKDLYEAETSMPLWVGVLSFLYWVATIPLFLIVMGWAEAQIRSVGCLHIFPEDEDWVLCNRPSGHEGPHGWENLPLRNTQPRWYWRQPRDA